MMHIVIIPVNNIYNNFLYNNIIISIFLLKIDLASASFLKCKDFFYIFILNKLLFYIYIFNI